MNKAAFDSFAQAAAFIGASGTGISKSVRHGHHVHGWRFMPPPASSAAGSPAAHLDEGSSGESPAINAASSGRPCTGSCVAKGERISCKFNHSFCPGTVTRAPSTGRGASWPAVDFGGKWVRQVMVTRWNEGECWRREGSGMSRGGPSLPEGAGLEREMVLAAQAAQAQPVQAQAQPRDAGTGAKKDGPLEMDELLRRAPAAPTTPAPTLVPAAPAPATASAAPAETPSWGPDYYYLTP